MNSCIKVDSSAIYAIKSHRKSLHFVYDMQTKEYSHNSLTTLLYFSAIMGIGSHNNIISTRSMLLMLTYQPTNKQHIKATLKVRMVVSLAISKDTTKTTRRTAKYKKRVVRHYERK
jgi:hypothetical protein